MLSDTGVKEYQSIYLKKYGKELSFEEAKQMANELLDFLSTLLPKKGGDQYAYEHGNGRKLYPTKTKNKA